MSAPAASEPRFEVIQTHHATGRVNLLAWDLTGPEASVILDQLEAAQCARQGAILVSGKPETGWRYQAREQGHPPPAPLHANGVAPRRNTRKGRP